ncbi:MULTISPECIES: hypothetical protein [unclassified Mameliella]|uniref:hypothetical protein n=1 Tax=unclassified Mameliella TaxID=2630630 RepID=UPI00273D0DE1|nr:MULTISPECIES: hypothetical protein [unclassified Mameliella]
MTRGYLNGDDAVTKANQIIALSHMAGIASVESAEHVFDFPSIFDVIRRLAYEISDQVEEIEREHKIGKVWGITGNQ